MSEKLISQLNPSIQQVWEKAGFDRPTSIQSYAIPFILENKDVIAQSPTGTGKTLAYLLPVLNKIDAEKKVSSSRYFSIITGTCDADLY